MKIAKSPYFCTSSADRLRGGAGIALLSAALLFGQPTWATAASDADIERLERQIQMLAEEIQRLKSERDADAASAPAPVATPAVPTAPSGTAADTTADRATTSSAADIARGVMNRVQLGGYGAVRYEASSADDTNNTFDYRRFVLTADAEIAPKLTSGFELEFERFRKLELERSATAIEGGLEVEQEVEGTSDSEITIEQAWFQYELDELAKFRMGGVLVPLGRFNLNHDDNRWDLPRRPLADRGAAVLPSKSAWAELGAGLLGGMEVGEQGALDYQLFVVNGVQLEPEVEEKIQTRGEKRDKLELEAEFSVQTGTFSKDVDEGKAVTGRVAYSPALGHEIAGSFYHGRYTPDWLSSEDVTAFGIDGLSEWGAFQLEGEFLYADYGDVTDVATDFAAVALTDANFTPSSASPDFESEIEFELNGLAERRYGYWLESRYDMRPAWLASSILGRPFHDPHFTAVLRGEQVWVEDLITELAFDDGVVESLAQADHRIDRVTAGLAYRPVPSVALQIAYEYTHVDDATLGTATNYMASSDDEAHTLLVGSVFGF